MKNSKFSQQNQIATVRLMNFETKMTGGTGMSTAFLEFPPFFREISGRKRPIRSIVAPRSPVVGKISRSFNRWHANYAIWSAIVPLPFISIKSTQKWPEVPPVGLVSRDWQRSAQRMPSAVNDAKKKKIWIKCWCTLINGRNVKSAALLLWLNKIDCAVFYLAILLCKTSGMFTVIRTRRVSTSISLFFYFNFLKK